MASTYSRLQHRHPLWCMRVSETKMHPRMHFCSEQGPEKFATIHKVFGASNVSKLLLRIPAHHRSDAVVTVAYEAQARIQDPLHGCVAHILALQQQVESLQAQLMQTKAKLAPNATTSPTMALESLQLMNMREETM